MKRLSGGPVDQSGLKVRLAATAVLGLALMCSVWSALSGLALQGAVSAIAVVSALSPATAIEAMTRRAVPIDAARIPTFASMARDGFASAPLMHEPFFFEGLKVAAERRFDRALPLIEESRRRRPAHVAGRMWLMSEYARRGRIASAIDEAAVTMRLNPATGPQILPVLVQFSRVREAHAQLGEALRNNPIWRNEFLTTAAAQKIDPLLTLSVIRAGRVSLTSIEQTQIVDNLIANGRYGEAFAYSRSITSKWQGSRDELIYDPGFAGLPGPRPINWTFGVSDQASAVANAASATEVSHLRVAYFGSAVLTLASQVSMARPGRYRLAFNGVADQDSGKNRIYWQVACLPGGLVLARLLVTPLPPTPSQRAVDLSVPATNCQAQSISLNAEPGEEAGAFDGAIRRLSLKRTGT